MFSFFFASEARHENKGQWRGASTAKYLFYFQRQRLIGLPKINLGYLFFRSHCALEEAMTASTPESHLSFLWKQAVICLHQTLNTTILHTLRLLTLKRKPEAPVHTGQDSPGDFSSGLLQPLCRKGAVELTALTCSFRLLVSLGAEVVSTPHPGALTAQANGAELTLLWQP